MAGNHKALGSNVKRIVKSACRKLPGSARSEKFSPSPCLSWGDDTRLVMPQA